MQILNGRSLELRELQEEHVPILFSWRNSSDFMELCSTRRNSVSLSEFQRELSYDFSRDRHIQFMIVRNDEYIGTLYSYNFNRTDSHAFVTIFIAEQWRGRGCGAEAMIIFLEYLFREYNLYKVYAEAYNYNSESLLVIANGGFVEEGRFTSHRLLHGERHDLVRFAFFRSQIRESASLVRRIVGRDPFDWLRS